MYFRTSSSSESRPCSASSTMDSAVNSFDIDATWKIDRGVIGTSSSRFAMPYPFSNRIAESRVTDTAQPGESRRLHLEKIESMRAASAAPTTPGAGPCARTGTVRPPKQPAAAAAIVMATRSLMAAPRVSG
jgi:hypothetical protein